MSCNLLLFIHVLLPLRCNSTHTFIAIEVHRMLTLVPHFETLPHIKRIVESYFLRFTPTFTSHLRPSIDPGRGIFPQITRVIMPVCCTFTILYFPHSRYQNRPLYPRQSIRSRLQRPDRPFERALPETCWLSHSRNHSHVQKHVRQGNNKDTSITWKLSMLTLHKNKNSRTASQYSRCGGDLPCLALSFCTNLRSYFFCSRS